MHRDGRNQSVYRRQAEALGTGEAKDGGRFTIGGESSGFEDIPHGKIALDTVDVASQALQDFGDDYSGGRERLSINNHAAQLSTGAARRCAKEIDPDGTIDQYQKRFLRAPFKSPLQTPLP